MSFLCRELGWHGCPPPRWLAMSRRPSRAEHRRASDLQLAVDREQETASRLNLLPVSYRHHGPSPLLWLELNPPFRWEADRVGRTLAPQCTVAVLLLRHVIAINPIHVRMVNMVEGRLRACAELVLPFNNVLRVLLTRKAIQQARPRICQGLL